MADLTTKFAGLTLKNPVIVGSSGLTDSVEKIVELEKNGAGAVVIKSLFEEEIMAEAEYKMKKAEEDTYMYARFSESFDYIDMHVKSNRLDEYVSLVKKAKSSVLIPVIASVNCVSPYEWTSFAKRLQDAGADALELNVFVLPADEKRSGAENEKIYFEVVEKILKVISIPVMLKISPYFSSLGQMVKHLSETGVKGITLFNRFYSPDFDIEKMETLSVNMYSNPSEQYNTLRWIAMMKGRAGCDLAASTGIHDGEALIKQLLAGANAVQIASTIYKNGAGHIAKMLNELENWMEKKGYNYLDQFRGTMSQENNPNPAAFERMQFMKYFSEIK